MKEIILDQVKEPEDVNKSDETINESDKDMDKDGSSNTSADKEKETDSDDGEEENEDFDATVEYTEEDLLKAEDSLLSSEPKGMFFDGALICHVGKVRGNNEDNFCFFGTRREDVDKNITSSHMMVPVNQALVAVCDGMGGEAAGEVASYIATDYLYPCKINNIPAFPLTQIGLANAAICREMENSGISSMGSTVTALYADAKKAVSVNLGDSRCYLLRDGRLKLLSHDHSEAQRYIDLGKITEAEARGSRIWHVLTQHLGIQPSEFDIEPYVSETVDLQKGDIFLLCTDGLTDMVSDAAIKSILDSGKVSTQLAADLVDTALYAGGRDNVTVVVLKVV